MSLKAKYLRKKEEIENQDLINRAVRQYGVTRKYVNYIMTGERNPVKGKGLKVKRFLEAELLKSENQ